MTRGWYSRGEGGGGCSPPGASCRSYGLDLRVILGDVEVGDRRPPTGLDQCTIVCSGGLLLAVVRPQINILLPALARRPRLPPPLPSRPVPSAAPARAVRVPGCLKTVQRRASTRQSNKSSTKAGSVSGCQADALAPLGHAAEATRAPREAARLAPAAPHDPSRDGCDGGARVVSVGDRKREGARRPCEWARPIGIQTSVTIDRMLFAPRELTLNPKAPGEKCPGPSKEEPSENGPGGCDPGEKKLRCPERAVGALGLGGERQHGRDAVVGGAREVEGGRRALELERH
mmetsp:Transcript_71807/g.226865  ORF Transcript_71807/g.226865 Transcript_71807/m.226865 type:complete len:288 (-) Transcript_71807:260-1123(-)